ncbi:MAG: DNA primase [bacterium]
MRYSEQILEEIRTGNDIIDLIGSYVQLKKSGNNYVGLCPFHSENTPSFNVSPHNQLYHCFGCGESGSIYNFVQNIENLNFPETVKFLADRINYVLPEKDQDMLNSEKTYQKKLILYKIHKLVARKYYDNLSTKEGNIANQYLNQRKIAPSIRIKYGLGYALKYSTEIYNFLKNNGYSDEVILETGLVIKSKEGSFFDRFSGRLMFPIIDVRGNIIGFGGREIVGNTKMPKYMNSPDTLIFNKSYNLYSINFAKNTNNIRSNKELILVEGYMDVLALYQIGIQNVVASLGTSFNEGHIFVLKKYASRVILLFDSDDAGTKAISRAIPLLIKNNFSVRVLQVTDAKDPDEYIKKWGSKNFINLLNNSHSYIIFQIKENQKKYNLDVLTQKIEFLSETAKIIANLNSPVERDLFIKEVSKMFKIDANILRDEVKLILPTTDPIEKIQIKNNKNNKNNNFNMPNNIKNSKLEEAKMSVLLALCDKNIADKLSKYVYPKDFVDNVYVELAKLILSDENRSLHPSDMVLKFSDPNSQKIVSRIFTPEFNFLEKFSKSDLEKIINSQVKVIKNFYYDFLLSNVDIKNSEDDMRVILKEKKYYQNLYIKIF